jgi:hypothetical protein
MIVHSPTTNHDDTLSKSIFLHVLDQLTASELLDMLQGDLKSSSKKEGLQLVLLAILSIFIRNIAIFHIFSTNA